MPDKNTTSNSPNPKKLRPVQTVTLGAWTVSVSRKDKNLSIETNDYHADPLVELLHRELAAP